MVTRVPSDAGGHRTAPAAILGLWLALAAAMTALAAPATGSPGDDWSTATPESAGLDPRLLAGALAAIGDRRMPVHSLLLARNDSIVLDAYVYPYDGSIYHDVASVTKSVLTTLVGIAADEGLLDLDAPVLSWFPDRRPADGDPDKARILVRHLAGMTSGLECIAGGGEVTQARMRESDDWVQFVLDLPLVHEPGTTFAYCSPGMHLLSAVLTRATGGSALDVARTELFGPLGITDVYWPADAQGYSHGWGDLALKPRDMARLGELFLRGGRWGDRQVVPSAWIAEATARHVGTGGPEDYGLGWWVGAEEEPIAYFAAEGGGGQRIVVVPSLDLVMVSTGGGFDWDTLIGGVVAAATDGWRPLPVDPEGEAELATALAGLATGPPALDPGPLPPMAHEVSGIDWELDANAYGLRTVRLDVDSPVEATLTLDIPGEGGPRVDQVGLDGVGRPSRLGRPIVAVGHWTDERTLVVEVDEGPGLHAYEMTFTFGPRTLLLETLGLAITGVPVAHGG